MQKTKLSLPADNLMLQSTLLQQNDKYDVGYYTSTSSPEKRYRSPFPITPMQRTMLPGANGFRGLMQSFGPGIQPSLWDSGMIRGFILATPNRSVLSVLSKNNHEHIALHHYITEEISVEGLKHTVGLLHAYYSQTGGRHHQDYASITLYGLLKMMGYDKPEDKSKQYKLMGTILYLSRTSINALETKYEQGKGNKFNKIRKVVSYEPLIALEVFKLSKEGGIQIPEVIKFRLGEEFYDLLFGEYQQYYSLPTTQFLSFHSRHDPQEICLALYLSSQLTLNTGKYNVHFPVMMEGSAIHLAEDIKRGHDRTRDALRTIYALEHLQKDGWITRSPHNDIDIALAIEYILKTYKPDDLAPETLERIKTISLYLQGQTMPELRKMRREAIQHLLDRVEGNAITLNAGCLFKEQAEKLAGKRQKAKADNDKARTARIIKAAREQLSKDLAK